MVLITNIIKRDLLLIFAMGGVWGLIDYRTFSIGYFFGSGLGLLFISILSGLILSIVLKAWTKARYQNNNTKLITRYTEKYSKLEWIVKLALITSVILFVLLIVFEF